MKYYIIAGEASGDLHASNLMKELKKLDTSSHFRCWGGDLMKAQGAELVRHYKQLAFMGFVEVIMNLRTILRNIDFCKKDILRYQPDALILVDYPGFNMRIATFAKQHGIKVFYYISPQIWAWKQSRVHKIKRDVNKMFVILPFEKDFYERFDYPVTFVGHPLLDAIYSEENTPLAHSQNPKEKPIIALLPGSRKQEISTMLPLMLSVVEHFPQYHFIVAGAPSQGAEFYKPFLQQHKVEIIYNQTYSLLRKAYAALVTSGTATLETALFNVPEVVCYKANAISYRIARQLIKVKYISLVNLVMDREVVKELIQDELTTAQLVKELQKITLDAEQRKIMLDNFGQLKEKLGGPGASAKTAREIIRSLPEIK